MIELDDLLQATQGRPCAPIRATRFTGLSCDVREVMPGHLFVAVRGDWADGHDDIPAACRQGAQGVLCERPVDLPSQPVTCIVVPDTRSALADWARLTVERRRVEVIGITGSAGKTSAKEAIAAMLEAARPVLKGAGDRGGLLSLAAALGQLRAQDRLAVIELPCEAPGDVAALAAISRPRCGVVLNVLAAHLETFGSLDRVAAEQARLLEALPSDGWAVLNCDDPQVAAMASQAAAQPVWFGLGPGADVRASDVEATEAGITFTLSVRGCLRGRSEGSVRLSCRLVGRHSIYPLLAAAAVGLLYGLPLEQVADCLRRLDPLPGRLQPRRGRRGALILDDTYSTGPASLEAALKALAELPRARKIAIVGDMAHLGAIEEQAHRQAGAQAAALLDALVTVGERARWTAQEALRQGLPRSRVRVTYTPGDALRAVEAELGPDVAVLVKGGAEARLEQVVEGLLDQGARPRRELVRRAPAWRTGERVGLPRPTWIEVDLEAIAENVRLVRQIVGEKVAIMAIVKADAYGHGAIKVAYTALNNGASRLGVACLSEALALRRAGIEAPILVLGYTPPWQARETVEHRVDATVFSLETAQALSQAALALGQRAHVHVKVDTGMGRLGLLPHDVAPFLEALAALPGLAVEGIFTHFATADSADRSHCNEQWRRFSQLLDELERRGLRPPVAHAANSAATLSMPHAHLDMVRVGIALYGLNPSSEVACPPGFRPALAFKTQVAQVKTVPAGSCVSYGCTYRTPRESRLAVIPVGYADGFRRAPQHWGHVLVRGQRAPIVGRVCMDQTIIDVTSIPGVRQGDEVVLIGAQGQERITADEVAARLGTINYEVVSEILARVPRIS